MLLLAVVSGVSSAATLRVEQDGTGDYLTIQDAVDAAAFGDRIEVGPGEYYEAVNFNGVELELVSTNGPDVTIIDPTYAEGTYNAITLTSGEAGVTRIEGFTLRSVHGTARHGIEVALGEVTVVDTRFDSLDASPLGMNGGGILAEAAVVNLEDCTFSETQADEGGAVYLSDGSTLNATGTTVENASATKGAGVAATDSTVEITSSTFEGNEASSVGGAIWASNSSVTASDVVFDSNSAENKGGGVYLTDRADLDCAGGSMVANSSDNGVVLASDSFGSVQFVGTEFHGNSGWSLFHVYSHGGGAFVLDGIALTSEDDVVRLMQSSDVGSVSIRGSSFDGTQAFELESVTSLSVEDSSFYGAGGFSASADNVTLSAVNVQYSGDSRFLHLVSGDVVIEDSDIADNSYLDLEVDSLAIRDTRFSGSSGIAVAADAPGGVTIDGSAFEDNGFYILDVEGTGPVAITDSRFAGNEGGVRVGDHVEAVTVEDSTFEGNVAALQVHSVPIAVRRTWFCDNAGAVVLVDVPSAEISNNVFLQSAVEEDGAALNATGVGALVVEQNSFLMGSAPRYGGALYVVSSELTFANNLVAWTQAGTGLAGNSIAADSSSLSYDAWWENTDADLGAGFASITLDSTHVFQDPSLASDSQSLTCGGSLWPTADSPLVDAGDPARTDADGTRSDIGAYGGEDPMPADRDGDGYYTDVDCDDADASVNPGASEVADDGVDNDCVNGDASIVDTGGGDPEDTDSADADTGGDSGAGGTHRPPRHDDGEDETGCSGCSSTEGGADMGWLLLGCLLAGRRRR